MKTSDEALAKAAASGDRDAFALLLERRYDGLFRLAFRLTGSRAEAEDLTQDICALLPSKLRAFRAEAKFSTWLYRVAVNAAHDRRRKAQTHARMAQGWGEWETAIKAEQSETSGQVVWLNEAMTSLPDDLRETVALVLDQEITHREAGEVLGVSEGTISWRISEAKKHLRYLAKQEAGQ
ncbi:MAG: RNA polymerase sigma factor [Marinosulfonomonas sp.]|nr:RNA polymerase sigma factor [Marinosulfonomonas sp.]